MRTETFVDYMDFVLPDVEDPADTVVPITDWYAAHLAQEVRDLVVAKTQSPLVFLGGGTTEDGAACDQEPHHTLNQTYKRLEERDSMEALKRRPRVVPNWSKQAVFDRGYEAWCGVRHECSIGLHKKLGYTLAIEGEDHLIGEGVEVFWNDPRLDMPRAQTHQDGDQ